jgi:ATP-dependent helicase/nuclease subunit A
LVDPKAIAAFFASELGQRLLASKRVYKELPFNAKVRAEELFAQMEGDVIIQGIVDCCFHEPNGHVLLDYKTDTVFTTSEEAAQKHRMQLALYGRALEDAGFFIKEKYVYFFNTRQAVRMQDA